MNTLGLCWCVCAVLNSAAEPEPVRSRGIDLTLELSSGNVRAGKPVVLNETVTGHGNARFDSITHTVYQIGEWRAKGNSFDVYSPDQFLPCTLNVGEILPGLPLEQRGFHGLVLQKQEDGGGRYVFKMTAAKPGIYMIDATWHNEDKAVVKSAPVIIKVTE